MRLAIVFFQVEDRNHVTVTRFHFPGLFTDEFRGGVIHFHRRLERLFCRTFIHGADLPRRVVEDQLTGLAGLLRTVVTSRRNAIIIILLPIQGRPGGIQHPLDDAGRLRNPHPERLEHPAGAVVVHGMGLPDEILQGVEAAVQAVHGLLQDLRRVHRGG